LSSCSNSKKKLEEVIGEDSSEEFQDKGSSRDGAKEDSIKRRKIEDDDENLWRY